MAFNIAIKKKTQLTNKQNSDEKQGYLSLNVLNTYKSTCTLRKSAWACQALHPG